MIRGRFSAIPTISTNKWTATMCHDLIMCQNMIIQNMKKQRIYSSVAK